MFSYYAVRMNNRNAFFTSPCLYAVDCAENDRKSGRGRRVSSIRMMMCRIRCSVYHYAQAYAFSCSVISTRISQSRGPPFGNNDAKLIIH